MSRGLAYVWYPSLSAAAIAAFGAMLASGMPLAVATYLPILVAALAIVALEFFFPERADWRPRRGDVASDAAFMALVQILVPRLLALAAVLAIAQWLHEHAPSPWWPHGWPLWAQVLAMVLAVDFLRYWVHRACHTWMPLWRLHEVHHSPDILYTLNVGRFHPLEKLLHFACDGLPFLLLGVAPEVLAGYFLLYAVNGFFQHSNLRLRYGWLNYVVGSAETHRWHHARDPRRAQCNFGNTVILWDLLFGTWYLPKDGAALDIGIMDRGYPKGFWAQMAAPFRGGHAAARRGVARRIADLAVPAYLGPAAWLASRRLARASRDPMRAQRKLLERLVRDNAATRFGRDHGFAQIRDYAGYARAVPVREFEALRPYIEAQMAGEPALTAEPPLAYLRTSGSTGKPKDLPLTASHLRELRRIQRTSVAMQYRACPQAFSGSILAIVSPVEEGRLPNGKPYGSASGIVAGGTPGFLKAKFVLPRAVSDIGDPTLKYLAILRLAVADGDITYFGSANPSTPLVLMKLYREHRQALEEDVARGTFFRFADLDPQAQAALRARLAPNPARAHELRRLHAAGRERMGELWPRLRMVVTWTCASAGITARALAAELAPSTVLYELGYVASEFRGTFSLAPHAASGMPTFENHFLEFAEREAWDRGERSCVTLDRLRKGVDYYVIASTASGLYRYFMNDVVRATGRLHATPLLRFVQKGRGVTNITGEKLYEAQVLEAVAAVAAELGLHTRFAMMIADEERRGYRLYLEAEQPAPHDAAQVARRVDALLRELNVEYRGKRESGRLAALDLVWLKHDTAAAYKAFCVARGQRESQFKAPALAYRASLGFDLDRHAA